jgi:ribosome biogenesis GTPase / thiamine phosphate phosphatase
VSVKAPRLRIKLVDRFLLAAERGGIAPVICVNKIDLLDATETQETLALLDPYCEIGVPVIACSAVNGNRIIELAEVLTSKLCVFIGHSGVGKSSLLNALDPTLSLRTGKVRKGDGKGCHTTTVGRLYRLASGMDLIDTPGIRELGLGRITLQDLNRHFREFAPFANTCRYANCRHISELGCGVTQAMRDGQLSHWRYESYCRLLEEVSGSLPDRHVKESMHTRTSVTVDAPIGFICVYCGEQVIPEGAGTQHRNHCPQCLRSVHLDNKPGDRAARCGGMMEPVAVWVRKGGEWAIIHRCSECGVFSSNRIAADDNEALLLSLAVKPLSMPPFPLDRLVIGT